MMTPENLAHAETNGLWPKRLRSTVLQDALIFACLLALSMTLISLFVSWQTTSFLREQIDTHLLTDAHSIASEPGQRLVSRLTLALSSDPQHKRVGGVFDSRGQRLAGNLDELPQPLPRDGAMGTINEPNNHAPEGSGHIRVGRISLPDGQILIFGRRVDELHQVGAIFMRSLLFATIPIFFSALTGGWFIWRTRVARLRAVENACTQIVAGNLRTRLPATRKTDEFRVVSSTINQMLDEMERLMIELRDAGDAMAHDLRTPLTRLRTRLGRIAEGSMDLDTTKTEVGRTIEDVDQLIGTIRAILRLGAIESGRRRHFFKLTELGPVAEAAAELYAPIAEEKGLTFVSDVTNGLFVFADGELLFEAIGNLLDNAIKFTPSGGTVRMSLVPSSEHIEIRIDDTGPGIVGHEREASTRRFYRSDPSRNVHGNGLGLAIVSAVARLHSTHLVLNDGLGGIGCSARMTLMVGRERPVSAINISASHPDGRPAVATKVPSTAF